jgi:hypothetical protein
VFHIIGDQHLTLAVDLMPLPTLPPGNTRKRLVSPAGVIFPMVPSLEKLTAYRFPSLSTAGPSAPEVKLLTVVRSEAGTVRLKRLIF